MPSVDFLLARLTAQSAPMEPRVGAGSVQQLTQADIAQATGEVRSTIGYYALMSNRCQSDLALDKLFAEIEPWSWHRWYTRKRTGRLNLRTHSRLVEVAVLYFLNPAVGEKRGDRGCAKFVGVARKTWALHFRAHYRDVSAYLFEEEAKAVRTVIKKIR